MELEFINRSIKINCILAVVCGFALSLYAGVQSGLAIMAGAAWGALNLFLIKLLVQNLLSPSISISKLFLHLGVKFPLLYLLGYALLACGYFPTEYLLIGSSLIFGVLLGNGLRFSMLSKTSLCLVALAATATLSAQEKAVPELPNIITLLHSIFEESHVMTFLHDWQNIVFSIFIACAISLVFHYGARNATLIPSKFQNGLEWIVEMARKFIVEIIGPEGEKYVPLLGTLFIYILVMNWMVLIPLMKPPSSSINITIALAVCVFCLVQYLNMKHFGFLGFMYHMAGSPKTVLAWAMSPLMFFIELLTQFTRPVTLAMRLFGNVVGEDILIGAFALFGVMALSNWGAPVGLPLQIPFMFLALLTGLMQALVFTLLSAIYILLSMPGHEE